MGSGNDRVLLKRWTARVLGAVGQGLRRTGDGLAHAERLARFARGLALFRGRPDDIYVATYPRSGTTWMQFLVHLMTSQQDLDFRHISEVSPWFERSLARGSREPEDFETLGSPRVFKTHLTPEWLPRDGRKIYVERDGRDVAVSYYHLYRSHLGFRGSLEEFFDRFMRGDLQYRSWFDHVGAWRTFAERHSETVLHVTYESMLEDIEGTARGVARFIGVELSEERWAAVLRMTSFGFMKAHEDRFDPVTETLIDQGLQPHAFIREGRAGTGRSALSGALLARFEDARRSPRRPHRQWRLTAYLH